MGHALVGYTSPAKEYQCVCGHSPAWPRGQALRLPCKQCKHQPQRFILRILSGRSGLPRTKISHLAV